MPDIIDLNEKRNEREQADPEFVMKDGFGRTLYTYGVEYEMDAAVWARAARAAVLVGFVTLGMITSLIGINYASAFARFDIELNPPIPAAGVVPVNAKPASARYHHQELGSAIPQEFGFPPRPVLSIVIWFIGGMIPFPLAAIFANRRSGSDARLIGGIIAALAWYCFWTFLLLVAPVVWGWSIYDGLALMRWVGASALWN